MERNRSNDRIRRKPSGAAVKRPELTEALYRAFFMEWAERGFAAISLEQVARRAGAGKAAIYRRFSSRHEFADQALSALALDIAIAKDHGSLTADMLGLLVRLRIVLRHPIVRRILPDLHAEAARSPEMRSINTRLAEARRDRAREMLDRAIQRGELPETVNFDLALDLLAGPLYWRMVVIGVTPSYSELKQEAVALTAALKALG